MHDGTVRTADDWLKAHLDPYVQWAKTHNSLLVVTWDEDGGNTSDNHIPTMLVGQPVKPGTYSTKANHFNLLRTVEDMYGLKPLKGAAEVTPITGVWQTTTSTAKTVTASADGYVRDGAPTTSYGSASTLHVKKKAGTGGLNRDAYVKFDTASVAGTLSRAKLRFYAALSTSGSVATDVFSVSDTGWTESALTWNHRPALGTRVGTFTVGSTSYGWYEVDVTAYVNAQRAAGRRTVSFGLHNPADSAAEVLINSREASSNRPALVLTAG
jgi:hypothetical protein